MTGRVAAVVDARVRMRARRRAGRRRTIWLMVVSAVVVLLGGLAGWALLWSPLFATRSITVEGTSRLTVAQVVHAADVSPGVSLLRVNPSSVAQRVEALPAVASADVSRDWPHTIVVRVHERRPVAAVPDPSGAELLDPTGVAFAHVPSTPAGVVAVRVAGPVPGPGLPAARAAARVVAALPAALHARLGSVRAGGPDDVTLRLEDGRTVVWGSPGATGRKLAVLRPLLRRHDGRVYDVSAPDVAVIR